MRLWNIGSRCQSDSPESFVVEFQGVTRPLDLPIRHVGACRRHLHERLDLRPPQFAPPSAWVVTEKPPNPSDIVGYRLFLRPCFPQRRHVPRRPLGFGSVGATTLCPV